MKLSVVICVYNEELNIEPLFDKLLHSLKKLSFEIIFVDDGSKDKTVKRIKKIDSKKIILIELRRNYGQSAALAAGIDYARGEYIATIDGDLQNDPADIPRMLELAEKEDWDVVAGIRVNRKDGMLVRKIPSRIANWIIRRGTGLKIRDYGCTLKLFKSEIAKSLGLYGELHRFIPILAHLEGASITQMNVRHHARIHGKSKYGLNRTFKVIADLLYMIFLKKYAQRPMQLFAGIGIVLFIIGSVLNIYLFILKVFYKMDIWGKPLLILGAITLLGGIQLITIGIIAEIQMRTYYESQNKKPYSIKKITSRKKT
jgi:glycosyltransferase involved in cell wall biosynthesis